MRHHGVQFETVTKKLASRPSPRGGPRVQAHALAQDAPALMIATGLALRSFD